MTLFRQGIKQFLSLTLPRRMWLADGPRHRNGVALTFDDGPHPEHTPRLLDELQRHSVRATFFVVGKCAEAHPGLIRRMVAEGHALGHHSYTHSEPSCTSATTLLAEVHRTSQLLEDLTGNSPFLFRPPKGELTLAKFWGLWRHGETIVMWNRDPKDYRLSSADPLIQWCRRFHPTAGDIILLHDNQPHCVHAIAELVQRLTCRPGLTFQPLTDWVSHPDPVSSELTANVPHTGSIGTSDALEDPAYGSDAN